MLTTLLHQQYEQFANLAATWLASGATAISIWSNGRMLAQWPIETQETLSSLATLSAPLRLGNTIFGELRVSGLNGSAAQERLRTDADLITQIIRLEDELEDMTGELIETQDQLIALYDLTRSMRSHLDISQTLGSLARTTTRIANVQVGFMLMDHSSRIEVVSHPVSVLDNDVLFRLFDQMRSSGDEVILDSENQPEELPEGVYNLCLVPIHVSGNIIAAMGLLNRPHGFTSLDLKLVRAIAGQAAAQIENVLLHQETLERMKLQTEMELATQAQLHLLPQLPPQVAGLQIYAESRPAMHVGGDFYDFVHQAGKPFIFSVGDVAGKGMSAALLMAMSRTAIRSKASFMPRATPASILSRSNDDLYGDFAELRKFATVFVGQYEPVSRKLVYTNAGHSPVIYCPRGGHARLLEANGSALGMLRVNAYHDQMLLMHPGDVLVAGTDGLSEARNPQRELFGFERLLQLTEKLVTHSAREIADALFQAAINFEAGFPQDDDQTLVVVKVEENEEY